MSLWTLLQAALMLFNAAAILNEQRFLEKYGWGFSQLGSRPTGEGPGALKHQIIGTLHAATYMRVPLIGFNIVVIFLKVVIG
ncbi:hypothetical protein Ndes2526B_g00239 [Nannochloris sp. 'desiccata']